MDTSVTQAQQTFMGRLERVMAVQKPFIVLTADMRENALRHWPKKLDADFVGHVAAVGPTLAKKIWREMCQPGT